MHRRPLVDVFSFIQWHQHLGVHPSIHPSHLRDVRCHFTSRHIRRRWQRRCGHRDPHLPHIFPHYFHSELHQNRYLMLYLALGVFTACLIEVPRRHWAEPDETAMRASAHSGCMKHSWRMKGAVDPYALEEESKRLRELTDATAYHCADHHISYPSHCLSTERPKASP